MGSVKDLAIIKAASASEPGVGHFHFSDRYSVFDWGEMPDLIRDKGKALCLLGAFFFEKLEDVGTKTHYQGVISEGKVKHLSQLSKPVDTMQVALVNVIKPNLIGYKYDYSAYNGDKSNFLIPLEVIYRNSLPSGSSVFRRLQAGSVTLEELGLVKMPSANDVLKQPILDASTKLEVTDRYLSWQEAQQIAALNKEELQDIKETTMSINNLISENVNKVGLENEDGKVEYAFDEHRRLMLVDILGTPDECRFTYSGIPVSKEVARIHYRNTSWHGEIEQAKEKDRANWKKLIKNPPPPLPVRLYELIGQLYQSTCNEVTQKEWFITPPLKEILDEIKEQIEM
jgi:phosphoribosylaminoimidazole-succinocarboxamide synthase